MNYTDPVNSHTKTGKWMLAISWIIVLVILTMIFGKWEYNQINPNQNLHSSANENDVIEVLLLQNKWGHYVFNGKINGKTVEFLLDTGASEVSIPGNLAQDLNLVSGAPLNRYTANGRIEVYASSVSSLEIGDIHLSDVFATINPNMKQGQILLGMSALKQVEFIQRDGTLILKQYR